MFKNIFESFFVMDAQEKPAPSFLAAYLITWIFWHNRIITTFIKTDGDFFKRLNTVIDMKIENEWFVVILITLLVVIARFTLNSVIYIFREWLDSKTQGMLSKRGYKSFISNKIHQQLSSNFTNVQKELLSSQDREKSAKSSENTANANLAEANENIITKEKLIDSQSNSIEEYQKQIEELESAKIKQSKLSKEREKDINTLAEEKLKLSNSNNDLKEQYNLLNEQFKVSDKELEDFILENQKLKNNLTIEKESNKTNTTEREHIKKNLIEWANNEGKGELLLLLRKGSELNESERYRLERLIKSKIIFPDFSKNQLEFEINSAQNQNFASVLNENKSGSGILENSNYNNHFIQTIAPLQKTKYGFINPPPPPLSNELKIKDVNIQKNTPMKKQSPRKIKPVNKKTDSDTKS